MDKAPKISVVSPVYGVERFIERSARSLLGQTFADAEFIFVDDASKDGSRAILESVIAEYPERNVRILTHDVNKGLPASRRTGVMAAQGDFIYNCDSDDWVEPDILEKMYDAAVSTGADFVYCDFYLSFDKDERYMGNPDYDTPDAMLRKGFLCGATKYNVWNKLIKRSLYDGIEFPVNHFKGGEDMVVIEMLAKAKKVAHVPKALYHYVKTNASAISEGFSEQRLIDIRYNADHAINALMTSYPSDLSDEIAWFKLNVKLPFLLSDSKQKYEVWKEWYPEANTCIMSNPEQSARNKVLQWMAWKGQWWFVRAYYALVYKFIYGVIFR